MIRPLLRLAALGVCMLALSGCVSLLPKSKPAHLYRFGVEAAAGPSQDRTVGVFRSNGTFQKESAGDRLLTIEDDRAAYVAQTRWVAPAAALFDEAVLGAFDAAPGKVRLISRGEPGKAAYALRLDVRNFEARYDKGPHAAPLVVVRIRASLVKADNSLVGDEILEAQVRAGGNRVGAIVQAYDEALEQALGKLTTWVDGKV